MHLHRSPSTALVPLFHFPFSLLIFLNPLNQVSPKFCSPLLHGHPHGLPGGAHRLCCFGGHLLDGDSAALIVPSILGPDLQEPARQVHLEALHNPQAQHILCWRSSMGLGKATQEATLQELGLETRLPWLPGLCLNSPASGPPSFCKRLPALPLVSGHSVFCFPLWTYRIETSLAGC